MNPLFACLILATKILAQDVVATDVNRSDVRTMPVTRTPESASISLRVAIPEEGQLVSGNPVWVQFRIDGFALGSSSSQFDRADEIAVSKMGQTIHVVVDNRPYFPVNEPALDPFNESGFYYDTSYKFEVPFRLKKGIHTIRMFPARSFGESLKGEKTFYALTFYVGKKGGEEIDLSQPYITYNEPSDLMDLEEGRPILLDFYVCNTDLSSDGYKVRLSIDGKVNRIITVWQPYYIYGLKRGEHTIRLELLNGANAVVPGFFNTVEQTITVQ